MLPSKTLLTAATLAALLLYLDAWNWRAAASLLEFRPRRIQLSPTEDQIKDYASLPALPDKPDPRKIQDPAGNMAAVYTALLATEQGRPGAVTRVVHYGESPTTADMITADVRSLLQKKFGDAGHGFTLVAKPWAWYQHRGIEVRGEQWSIHPAHQGSLKDGLFGLGGVTFVGTAGSTATVKALDKRHTVVEFAYLAQPGGGSFQVFADKTPLGVVNTAAETPSGGFAAFTVPEGVSEFSVGSITGRVRLFGVRLGKERPGVMYDSVGLNGASIMVPSRSFNEDHWLQQLRHANPHLVILNYGINESVYAAFVEASLEKELRRVIGRVRKALPAASLLVMAPMDRGGRDSSGAIITPPALTRVVEIQQKVAADMGCAFFNTFEAMGGSGTMAKWYNDTPRLVSADLLHPMPAGARKVGELLYQALVQGFLRFKVEYLSQRAGLALPDGNGHTGLAGYTTNAQR
jgi:lysophospholipase L1-like esterase